MTAGALVCRVTCGNGIRSNARAHHGSEVAHVAHVMHTEQPDLPEPQVQGTPRGLPALWRTQPAPKPVQLPHTTHTMHWLFTNLWA